MRIHVRIATPDDYERICELMDQVDSLHYGRLPEIYRRPEGPARGRSFLDAVVRDNRNCLLVAEIDGQAAGFIHGILRDAPPDPLLAPRTFAKVDSMAVDERYRRRGAGTMLLDGLRQWAQERGADSLELNVHEFNHGALKFYRAQGFDVFRYSMKKPLR